MTRRMFRWGPTALITLFAAGLCMLGTHVEAKSVSAKITMAKAPDQGSKKCQTFANVAKSDTLPTLGAVSKVVINIATNNLGDRPMCLSEAKPINPAWSMAIPSGTVNPDRQLMATKVRASEIQFYEMTATLEVRRYRLETYASSERQFVAIARS